MVYIEENSREGTLIARVNATNSFSAVVKPGKVGSARKRSVELTFKLLTCNETFKIIELSGEVSVLDPLSLDYERIKEFRLTIEAGETKAKEMRYGMTNMIVKLKNLNDPGRKKTPKKKRKINKKKTRFTTVCKRNFWAKKRGRKRICNVKKTLFLTKKNALTFLINFINFFKSNININDFLQNFFY